MTVTPKKFVWIIAGVIVLCSAASIAIHATKFGFDIVSEGMQFGVTCLLAFSLIMGWDPGRQITIGLMGFGAGALIVVGLLGGSNGFGLQYSLGMPVLGLVIGACVAGLMTPTAKTHFTQKSETEQPADAKSE